MPLPPRPSRHPHALALLAGGLLCLLAVGAGLAWVRQAPASVAGPATNTAADTTSATAAAAPTAASTPATAAAPLLTPAQWARLQAALATHPQRDAETARILDLLAYQRVARQFQARRQAGAPAPELAALARRLDEGLAARIQRGEVSGPEALRLKTALLDVLEPDPAQSQSALAAWRTAQSAAHPPAVDPRDAALLQAQQALVARWRAQAPAGAPPDALLAELEALRQRLYANNTSQGDRP